MPSDGLGYNYYMYMQFYVTDAFIERYGPPTLMGNLYIMNSTHCPPLFEATLVIDPPANALEQLKYAHKCLTKISSSSTSVAVGNSCTYYSTVRMIVLTDLPGKAATSWINKQIPLCFEDDILNLKYDVKIF